MTCFALGHSLFAIPLSPETFSAILANSEWRLCYPDPFAFNLSIHSEAEGLDWLIL